MKRFYPLLLLVFLYSSKVLAGTQYTSPATGYLTISNATQWNAISWTTVATGNAYNEYILQPGFTVLVGPNGNHDIDLTSTNVVITVYGRIGFYNGNNTISLTTTSQLSVMIGGQVGFADNNGSWYGDAGDRFYFGSNPSDFVKGPFYVFGPDVISLATPPQSSYLWTGSVSTAWTDGNNWIKKNGNPAYPTSSYNAVIPGSPSGARFPHITTNTNTVRALALAPGSQLTIESNGALSTYDSLHNYGTITVQSGGALVQTPASKSCDYCPGGTFNIERQTGPVSPWYMGSPIEGLAKSGFSSCGNAQFNTTICDAPATGGAGPCVMSFHEDATISFNCTHNLWFYESAGTFTSGKGYALYAVPGTLAFSGNAVNNGAVSYGPLGYSNKGNVNLPAGFQGTTTRGWHIVSNPYPSPIVLTGAQLNAMGFDAQIQRWNSATGTWVSSNPLSSVVIAVGQAFEVKVNGAPGSTATFAVDNTFRSTVTNPAFYKTEDVPQQQYVNLTISNGNAAQNNTSMVYFQDGATTAFDHTYDANQLFGLEDLPYVYTLEQNGELLSYNALPLLTAGNPQSVPVGIYNKAAGNLSLTFEGINTVGANVVLEDLKTGTLYPVTEGYVHNFTTQAGDAPLRFMLHFNKDNTTTGITSVEANNITLFPNPTANVVNLLLQPQHGFNEMSIINLQGQVVLQTALQAGETTQTIDLSALPAGVYTIKLSGSNTATRKIVRQ